MEKDKTINYYVVSYIDILGQRERLKRFRGLPDITNESEMKIFSKIVKETFGAVEIFHNTFENYYSSFGKDTKIQFTPEQKEIREQIRQGNTVKIQRMSDSVTMYLTVRNDLNKVPCEGIFKMLGACATSFLTSASIGYFVRGGIELGIGMEMKGEEIYGPVLSEVYNLEHSIAHYPRIVIGEELEKYLRLCKDNNGDDICVKFQRGLAKICLEMLTLDKDGKLVLDYVGEVIKKYMNREVIESLSSMAHANTIKEYERFKMQGNEKLTQRYRLLREFFDRKQS